MAYPIPKSIYYMMPPAQPIHRVERCMNFKATDVYSKAYPDPSLSLEEEKTWVNMMTDRIFIPENNKLPEGFIPDQVCSIEMLEMNNDKENIIKSSRSRGSRGSRGKGHSKKRPYFKSNYAQYKKPFKSLPG